MKFKIKIKKIWMIRLIRIILKIIIWMKIVTHLVMLEVKKPIYQHKKSSRQIPLKKI